jgi:DNA-binding MarR family transcriptional regulator
MQENSSISTLEPVPAESQIAGFSKNLEDLKSLLAVVNLVAIRLRRLGSSANTTETISTAGGSVLKVLEEQGPRTVPQIARLRSTSRQNIQMVVNRLQNEGFLQLVPNPGHRRSALVELTDAGKQALPNVLQTEDELLTGMLRDLSGAEVQSALQALGKIGNVLEAQKDPATHRAHLPATSEQPSTTKESARRKSRRRSSPAEVETAAELSTAGTDLPVNLL